MKLNLRAIIPLVSALCVSDSMADNVHQNCNNLMVYADRGAVFTQLSGVKNADILTNSPQLIVLQHKGFFRTNEGSPQTGTVILREAGGALHKVSFYQNWCFLLPGNIWLQKENLDIPKNSVIPHKVHLSDSAFSPTISGRIYLNSHP